MKILVVCQHYYPEPFRISDICEELVRAGHEVLVVTGTPNYPEGKIYAGYKFGQRKNETINGVRVHRCFTIGRRKGIIFRLLNYYSFAISSTLHTLFMKEHFDVVFINQLSPVMMANAGIAYKKKYGTKTVLYCLDLWPESLTVGGIKKGSLPYRIFHKISERIYRSADEICISSKTFAKYFEEEFGITDTHYLPQYSEDIFDPANCKKVPDEFVDLMFAGNVGKAQSIETIIYAAEKTQSITNLRWHIVGDGSELQNVQHLAETLKLKNVIFHGRQSLADMPKYYAMADAMLVTMQKNDVISMTLPGKMQTYMAAGKAVLGSIGGETAEVIKEAECGLCCPPENPEALAAIAVDYMTKKTDCNFEENSSKHYQATYSKDVVVEKLLNILEGKSTERRCNKNFTIPRKSII